MGNFPSDLFVDVATLPSNGYGFVQLCFLMMVYAYVLSNASNMVSDGSELLLLVPSVAGIVGSVVLPVLGAVPDGAIVLFSGLGKDAQQQLSVGVGALAGSTIMLLTVPWFLSVLAGRVSLDAHGKGAYKNPAGAKLSPPGSMGLFTTGINVGPAIKTSGIIMIVTSISYVFIQGPAFGLDCGSTTDVSHGKCHASKERPFAIAGFVSSMICFVGYLYYQVRSANDSGNNDLVDEMRKKAIAESLISLSGAFAHELESMSQPGVGTALLESTQRGERLKGILRSFFQRYDRDNSGTIDAGELILLLNDLGEQPTKEEVAALMVDLDKDASGNIDFDEFTVGCLKLIKRRADGTAPEHANMRATTAINDVENALTNTGAAPEDSSSDEEEEIPEDLQSLSPEEQQTRIKIRSAWMMALGTALVLIFSDPMVDVLSEFGNRIHVPPFYVAFVLAPLASNASELIAAYNYAQKKTQKTITIALSTLEGAACMNNTFCLGIFLGLIMGKGLLWEFSAETISIIMVELLMLIFAFRSTQRLIDGYLVLMLYPLSLVVVWVLENIIKLN
eukprot:a842136_521.p1 GENE.a842136_521~~a842136_521.p1  ORF type:complete len:576 (-),score=280.96 a842136_521:53-1741(-)